MAAILLTTVKHFLGTSAERVALTTTEINAGSTFEEADTGLKYRWSGAAWYPNIQEIGYALKKVSATFTRPGGGDTTQYAVGDAVTNSTSSPAVFQLDLGAVGATVGQAVEIRKITVISSAKQTTLPLFNVYLSATTFTATNDNSALDIDDTTMNAGGAWIALDEQNYTASNSRVSKTGCNCPMILAAADTKFYGTLQAANAYTPVSAEVFYIVAWVALL